MGLEAVFDIECDGFNPTKIHCACLSTGVGGREYNLLDYPRMRGFFEKAEVLIGHNIIRFDIPHTERILGIKIKARLVDTLALSWYLYPKRVKHGLADWGEEFGVPKPVVEDWDNLPIEVYVHRCSKDVEINQKLWDKMWKDLLKLYGDADKAWRLIDYLTFKMDCAREQEASRWLLDTVKCTTTRDRLVVLQEEKVKELALIMPEVPVYGKVAKPKKPYKLNKELSVGGKKWFDALKRLGLPADTEGVVEEVVGWKEPNPGSHTQVKDWLYSLGWVPETFEFKRDKETGDVRQIPQVNLKHGAGVCPSIKRLFLMAPGLEVLEGLSVLTHRIGVLNGFLANVDGDGYVQAKITGLTNTLRFKHGVVVNLPRPDKPHGADIRGCLVSDDGCELVGADMSSLEDRTKLSFMNKYDPAYVADMSQEGYDPHLSLGVVAGMITENEMEFYKWYQKNH
jgi:hypothetical protein